MLRRMVVNRLPSVLVAAALAVPLAGCSASGDRPASASRPNLLLITMDTTRADHLGAYGDSNAATPNLDRLASEGALADHAIAVAPVTLPAHVSILTGLYPPRHGVRDNADFRLPESETTLAEHLKAQGYGTAAVVGAFVLAGELGLSQGFDRYDDPKPTASATSVGAAIRYRPLVERRAGDVTDAALTALDRLAGKPFFLWVHYYDPHAEYEPPVPWSERFASRLYDGEIAYMDSEIGRLLDMLRSRGILDTTLVLAIADHGESLGEHGEETHGLFVYDATVSVPLLARFPERVPAGTRYEGLVSQVDLVPTALDLMGLPPLRGVQGHSVADGLSGKGRAEREPVYAEAIYPDRIYGWAPLLSLRSLDRKFIEAPEPELYDLADDPPETRNLAASRPEEAADWKRRLLAAVQGFGGPDPSAEAAATAEQKAVLESLGYLTPTHGGAGRTTKPDPKRLAAVHNTILRAKSLVASGKREEVEGLLREALRADPENPAARALLGTVEFTSGRTATGIASLEASARAAPAVYETQWNLANALHLAGRHADAERAYLAAIALQPGSGEAYFGLGNVHMAMKRPADAIAAYRGAMEAGLRTPQVEAALGAALSESGDTAGAEQALRRAVEGDPTQADVWNKLGILAEKAGHRDEALTLYERAVAARSDHADGLFNRGRIRLMTGNREGARADAVTLVAKHPGYAAGWLLDANVRMADGDREGARASLRKLLAVPGVDPKLAGTAEGLLKRLGPR